jgi:bidirectional [NiFe] hydrogenase diaphorase subunit
MPAGCGCNFFHSFCVTLVTQDMEVIVCKDIEGTHTWDISGRGIKGRVISDLNQPWGSSETCTGCGKCVQVCPTEALSEKGKAVAEMTKRPQFLPYLQMMRKANKP